MRQVSVGQENMPPVAINVPARREAAERHSQEDLSGSPGRDGLTGYPIMEQSLYAVQTVPGGKQVRVPVVLKVYASNFGGRYAVVAQDKGLCRDCGYINLKHCIIQTCENLEYNRSPSGKPLSQTGQQSQKFYFQIVSTKNDGQTLMFMVSSRTELEQFLSVLTEPEERHSESMSPKLVFGSPSRRSLGEFTPSRVSSPRLVQKQTLILPALEEE